MFSLDNGYQILNLITCFELVIAALAQAMAFSYKDFIVPDVLLPQSKRQRREKPSVCGGIQRLLFGTKELMDDAHNTFIKDYEQEVDKETQMDELLKGEQAFNWSDEEHISELDDASRLNLKQKYPKRSRS